MNDDDYLWDRTGEPDEQVAHLEKVLGVLRWSKAERKPLLPTQARGPRKTVWIAAAAALVVMTIGVSVVVHRIHAARPLTSWRLSFSGETPKPMRAGQIVETRGNRSGTIESGFVGRVDIGPDSRLRLLVSTANQQRLALDHGTIHAFIWSPPAQFVVDTPAAQAVDLGCQYTLRVERTGVGLLTVQMGWVAFQRQGTESFIPAGAACSTRPERGPGTPYFLDSSPAFQHAIAEFDLNGSKQALSTALATARGRDGLTLWHMLQRVPANERAQVFDRFAALVSLPPEVNRDAILRSERHSLDAAWNALNLGTTNWWREWKRQW